MGDEPNVLDDVIRGRRRMAIVAAAVIALALAGLPAWIVPFDGLG